MALVTVLIVWRDPRSSTVEASNGAELGRRVRQPSHGVSRLDTVTKDSEPKPETGVSSQVPRENLKYSKCVKTYSVAHIIS